MKNKKAQLEMLAPAILLVMIAGFVLFFGLQMLNGFGDTMDNYATTITNETGWLNGTGYNLSAAVAGNGFNSPVIVTVYNISVGVGNLLITSGNYTVTSAGFLTNLTATNWLNTNITYTFKAGQEGYRASTKGVTGLATFGDFWSLIVLAIVITIVVALVLGMMNRSKVN